MHVKESYSEMKITDEEDIVLKKSFIMTLGNSRDLDKLLNLLMEETDEDILLCIVNVLGALAENKSLEALETLKNAELSQRLNNKIDDAIEVIKSLNNY